MWHDMDRIKQGMGSERENTWCCFIGVAGVASCGSRHSQAPIPSIHMSHMDRPPIPCANAMHFTNISIRCVLNIPRNILQEQL